MAGREDHCASAGTQKSIDVLIPTCNRAGALAVTLTSLCSQSFRDFDVIVSDQSENYDTAVLAQTRAVVRVLERHGSRVIFHKNLPKCGLAQQRAFLLAKASASYCLCLDDDVILEWDLLARLFKAIEIQRCGFVGSALIGLSFIDDERPEQQAIEFWNGSVVPERVRPATAQWERHHLHSAANLLHVQDQLAFTPETERLYRVAWISGCVLFDTHKLRATGGFDFWPELPADHCGEDVLAQLRVMERYGGCGIIPSGAYHQELPTTVVRRTVNAPKVLL